MKTLLVICPEHIDVRELGQLRGAIDYEFIYSQYSSDTFYNLLKRGATQKCDVLSIINDIVAHAKDHRIDGVMSSHDCPGSIIASIVAQELNIPGPYPEQVLLAQHKYYSRVAQQRYVPEAVPDFTLISPKTCKDVQLSFPVLIKPVKGRFSIGASCVYTPDALQAALCAAQLPSLFLDVFNQLLCQYTKCESDAFQILAEQFIDGYQVTFEGYVYNGMVEVIGVVDSIMYPGTISFKSFEYPTRLAVSIQKRMKDIVTAVLQGMGLDNTLFNIEFIYDQKSDRIYIIEINTRMSSQFGDIFEKVDGVNSYLHALDLAVGKKPGVYQGAGKYDAAGIYVLRIFEDKRVMKIPSEKDITHFMKTFPDARLEIFVKEGQKISDVAQDGKSFRYALFSVGASDHEELHEKFERGKKILDFSFEPV